MSREGAIRQIHAAVTPDALEALANKGLLRRAQKDLERGEVGPFEMSDAGLSVLVSGQRVILVETGPAKAVCSCPAPGVCQHILAACLKLSQEPRENSSATSGSASEEWLALSDEEIVATFGLPTLRVAHELSFSHDVQMEKAATVKVRFPTLNAEVIGLPGAGLAGIIVNGLAEKRHAQLAAAALLKLRREAGKDWTPSSTESRNQGPIHREEVLLAVNALLEEAVASGLVRLTPGLIERLDALAVAAQTAELHRLGLLLQRIATQSIDWLRRRPHADLGQIFSDMAMAYALAHSAPNLRTGSPREAYLETGSLDLLGVAAWPWRTASGYEGLTLLLWDTANANWNTWSDARPRAFQGGFSGPARYTQPGPWDGADSPAQLAHSRFRLMHAKRSRWGRLSSSAKTQALVTGAADLSSLPVMDDWSALEVAPSLGLREADPRMAYQLLRPAVWERQPFDPISQALCWLLRDRVGHTLEMVITFDDLSAPAIKRLESLGQDELEDVCLLGRCDRLRGGWQVRPLAIVRQGKASSLYFGDASARKPDPAATALRPEMEEEEEEEEGMDVATDFAAIAAFSGVSRFALAAISTLEWLAEAGIRSRNPKVTQRLEELAKEASHLALPQIESKLQSLSGAASWLRLRWVFALLLRAAAA